MLIIRMLIILCNYFRSNPTYIMSTVSQRHRQIDEQTKLRWHNRPMHIVHCEVKCCKNVCGHDTP